MVSLRRIQNFCVGGKSLKDALTNGSLLVCGNFRSRLSAAKFIRRKGLSQISTVRLLQLDRLKGPHAKCRSRLFEKWKDLWDV